ncbi:MAG: Gmad2 immunoglobulin-like domain-containing protein [Anaerolineae bacterium]|nr:Gmad2 immunoglobulin-like domain-containing protein [Anaerolineae bacterium]MDK1081824.1 Gmad2 immunoglobulin-like domain-containing protein [Anaerolineae bacterium]MDK1117852.1 Gmad2 immunoglobulin-like domain-containing protein [Anaerolineae bacterium]
MDTFNKLTERMVWPLLLTGLLLLGACARRQTANTDQDQLEQPTDISTQPASKSGPSTLEIPGISIDQLRNSQYQPGFVAQIRLVQLTDGQYEEGTPGGTDYLSITLSDQITGGDLNGDGQNEAVVIVSENYGESGSFVFLVVYEYRGGEPVFLSSVFLDDHPEINALTVEDGQVFLDIQTHASDDALCCPSSQSLRHYKLDGTNLILSDYSTTTSSDEPRVLTIEAPLNDIEISGIIRIKGNITISPFENNLVYRVYDLGGVELSAGPITVYGAVLGGPGKFEKAIDLGNILTNTSIRIVVEDINIADGSIFAMDSVILKIR